MAFNITEFNGTIAKYGVARDNLFMVNITPPDLGIENGMPMQDLSFFCNSVALPGINLQTAEMNRQGYGVTERRPTGMSLDNLNTTFMVDSTFRVKEFFHRWIQGIVNFDNSRGYNYEHRGMLPYETAYHERYVGTITVYVYSFNQKDITYAYRFGNAYPISTGDVTTAWSNNDSLMSLPVSFAYDTYQVQGFGDSVKGSRVNSSRGFGGGGVDGFITRLGNFGQALDALGAKTPIQDIVNQYSSVASSINSGLNSIF